MELAKKKLTDEKNEVIAKTMLHIASNKAVSHLARANMKDEGNADLMMNIVRKTRNAMNEEKKDNIVENSILYLSLLADGMEQFLNAHKQDARRHENLMEWNLFQVNTYSLLISFGMLLSACAQLIVIKSYFTGSLSLKFWNF